MTGNRFSMYWCISESMGDRIIILFADKRGYYCNMSKYFDECADCCDECVSGVNVLLLNG